MITALLSSLRPKQWSKNLLVFAAYLFTVDKGHTPGTFLTVLAAFGLFCAVSGASYILNDTADIERDRNHPKKCKRPIASGRLSPKVAVPFALLMIVGAIYSAFKLEPRFGMLLGGYFILTSAYSISLKNMVIVDLIVIAAGFVIRAVAGAMAINVSISPWLLVCTSLLALFLGLAKRRSELLNLEAAAVNHRATLGEYSAEMLDQMLNISAASALMAYFLYTFSPESKTAASHPYMMATVPFVIYGLFRYLYLLHTKDAGRGFDQILLEDRPMLVNLILWIVVAVLALKIG